MFKRTRIALQIVLTLFSFFGFNEAVLAARYRTTVYVSHFDARMAVAHTNTETPAFAGYIPAHSGEKPLVQLTRLSLNSL